MVPKTAERAQAKTDYALAPHPYSWLDKATPLSYLQGMSKRAATVVVIEDDEAIRESMKDLLQMEGYEVLGFANGQEAVQGLDNFDSPCLILLDWMMPVMDGAEFLQARQNLKGAARTAPVIVVSAVAGKIADAPTASGFLRKPLDLDVLLNLVEKHCSIAAGKSSSPSN